MVRDTGHEDLRASSERIEALLQSFAGALPPAQARAKAEELVGTLVRLYGAALSRILHVLREAYGDDARGVLEQLTQDELVGSVLVLHGLHPLSLEERIEKALDTVRPYIASHGGRVELLGIDGSIARLRMAGSCHGCPSSNATLKLAVERAILEACPEIAEVQAEGAQRSDSGSLQILSDWLSLQTLPEFAANDCAVFELADTPVLLLRNGTTLYAYRNQCPSCLRALTEASLEHDALTCPACGARFDVVHAGRSLEGGKSSLEPFPLVSEAGRIRLTIPVTA
ncbi:MAG: NifU family protein [Vulcanimicrobiaceae bacterium]